MKQKLSRDQNDYTFLMELKFQSCPFPFKNFLWLWTRNNLSLCSTSTKIDPDLAANIYHSCYKGGFLNLNRNKTTFPKNCMYFGLFPITINLLGNYTDFKNYSHRLNKLLINRVTEKKEIRALIFLYSKSLCIICLLFLWET